MLPSTFRYGLRATIELARQGRGRFVKVQELSDRLGVPRAALAKSLHALGAAGILETQRGPHGGCRWKPEAGARTLAEVAVSFHLDLTGAHCILGFRQCQEGKGCLLPGIQCDRALKSLGTLTLDSLVQLLDQSPETYGSATIL